MSSEPLEISCDAFEMSPQPLLIVCAHISTTEERRWDPEYVACGAAAGEPCRWARRYDGVADPAFHAERLEAAEMELPQSEDRKGQEASFDAEVLETGLV